MMCAGFSIMKYNTYYGFEGEKYCILENPIS